MPSMGKGNLPMICDLKWPRTGPVAPLSLEAGGLFS